MKMLYGWDRLGSLTCLLYFWVKHANTVWPVSWYQQLLIQIFTTYPDSNFCGNSPPMHSGQRSRRYSLGQSWGRGSGKGLMMPFDCFCLWAAWGCSFSSWSVDGVGEDSRLCFVGDTGLDSMGVGSCGGSGEKADGIGSLVSEWRPPSLRCCWQTIEMTSSMCLSASLTRTLYQLKVFPNWHCIESFHDS